MTPQKWSDTDEAAFKRIAHGIRQFANHAVGFFKHTAQVAELIAEAKARQIWKSKYSSFREFCEKECGFTARWADELIRTQKTILEIQAVSENLVLASEAENKGNSVEKVSQEKCPVPFLSKGQRQQLDGLSAEEKARVWQAAKAKEPDPSPKTLAATRDSLNARDYSRVYCSDHGGQEVPLKQPPPKLSDEFGDEIPESIVPLWLRSNEVPAMVSEVNALKAKLAALSKTEDKLWAAVNFHGVQASLSHAAAGLRDALPYALCPKCATKKTDCDFCFGRGFVGKRKYDERDKQPANGEALKEFREAWCADYKDRFNQGYKWDFVLDGKAAKLLLNGSGKTLPELREVWKKAWKTDEWNCSRFTKTVRAFNRAYNSVVIEVNGALKEKLSFTQLKAVLTLKEEHAKELKNKGSYEAATGVEWKDKTAREEYVKLRGEIKTLKTRMEAMA